MTENKVTYGLENVHVAPIQSISETGVITYGQVFRFPGAMELTLDPKGDSGSVKADNIDYHFINSNEGYEGKFKIPHIIEAFATKILGDVKDPSTGVVTEKQMQRQPTLLLCLNSLAMLTRHVMSCITVQQAALLVDHPLRTEPT